MHFEIKTLLFLFRAPSTLVWNKANIYLVFTKIQISNVIYVNVKKISNQKIWKAVLKAIYPVISDVFFTSSLYIIINLS